jgi:hypothetical protein
MNLATNQRAKRRDRTNVCMFHLDHLLQLPWAHLRARRPPKPRAPILSLRPGRLVTLRAFISEPIIWRQEILRLRGRLAANSRGAKTHVFRRER